MFIYLMDIHSLSTAFRSMLVCCIYAILAAENARLITIFVRKKAPGISNSRKRIQLIIVCSVFNSLIISFAEQVTTFNLGGYKSLRIADYPFIVGLQLMCTLLVILAYEGLYYMENWKRLFTESEKMKESNLSSQYNFLKNQIKPHFLFNSLNTLSSIIVSDPVKAERYVEEMSTVYRYLLKKNEKDLATLTDELKFTDSYIMLLKVRFGEALLINIDVDDKYYDFLLPPLVLQLLIENAVKHNIVSKEKPLTITIKNDTANNLHLYNTLQKKNTNEFSEYTGLNNLRARYRLMGIDHRLCIREEATLFKVSIPLIEENVYAGLHSAVAG